MQVDAKKSISASVYALALMVKSWNFIISFILQKSCCIMD